MLATRLTRAIGKSPKRSLDDVNVISPTKMSSYASVLRPGLFAGQLHWVTGGGSGIGRCVAHELASLGATVLVSGRTPDKLDRVAAEIAEDGGRAVTRAFDIRDEEAVKAAVASVVAEHGRIHGLVNNAGGQFPAPLQAISKRGFDAVVANNLTGGFLMMREVMLQSMQKEGGAIVNMTADFRNGMPGMGHSGAARAGMAKLTMTAAYEWAMFGIRAGLDRIERHGHLRRHDPHADPQAQAACADAPARRGGRGERGDLLPALARGGVHHRRDAADRRRLAAGERDLSDGGS
jgi:citronellol/citronellal dehydrogenase